MHQGRVPVFGNLGVMHRNMRLVTLLEAGKSGTRLGRFLETLMAEFNLPDFLYNVSRLEMYSNYPIEPVWKEKHRGEMLDMLSVVLAQCQRSGLRSADGIQGFMVRLAQPEYNLNLLPHHISELRQRIVSDLGALRYFEIPENRVAYWTMPRPFHSGVITHFKSCAYDFDHASTCIAVDEYTGSVFHSCRVVEIAIEALWLALGGTSPVTYDRSWGKLLRKIKDQVQLRENSKDPNWIKRVPEMWAAHGAFSFAKSAWRDDTMHVGSQHDDKEAIKILSAVRTLMEHLSQWFDEKGQWLKP